MSPKMRKFSADGTSFKKSPRDLGLLKTQEQDDNF